MAGGSTQSRDLKGRTVLPGFAATHDHPMDWDQLNPYIVKKVVTDDMHIERFLNEAPEQNLQKFPRVLEEAVRAAKPGQWIRISLLHGREYRGMRENTGFLGRQITKQMLDLAAPDNPVLVRAGFVGMVVNQKAFELTNQWYEENGGDNMPHWGPLGPEVEQNGLGSVSFRGVEQDVLYPNDVLREIYRLGTSWWAGYGVTLNASGHLYGRCPERLQHPGPEWRDRDSNSLDLARVERNGSLRRSLFSSYHEPHAGNRVGSPLDGWSLAGWDRHRLHHLAGYYPGSKSAGTRMQFWAGHRGSAGLI